MGFVISRIFSLFLPRGLFHLLRREKPMHVSGVCEFQARIVSERFPSPQALAYDSITKDGRRCHLLSEFVDAWGWRSMLNAIGSRPERLALGAHRHSARWGD